jgi:NAD(P)-dependent dehydrogenase (short-subunit alcohol dehydrogenase family)
MKTIAITGVSSGIWKSLFEYLAWEWHTMIWIVRGNWKDQENHIRHMTRNQNIHIFSCDLSQQDDIVRCAHEIQSHYNQIDILIHNAWIYSETRKETSEGIELTLAVNVIAPFLLTEMLIPLLIRGEWGVYMISSIGEKYGKVDWDDIMSRKNYSGNPVYNKSKLLLTLLTYKFAKVYQKQGVVFHAIHPWSTSTHLIKDGDIQKMPWYLRIIFTLVRYFRRAPEDSARMIAKTIFSPVSQKSTALFFINGKVVPSSRASYDLMYQKKVWDICCEVTTHHDSSFSLSSNP